MAELEINVVTEGMGAESSETPAITTIVVVNYSNITPIDYSNTIVVQNANNASVVSFFPLVGNEPQTTQVTQTTQITQPASAPISTGGSAY